MSDKQTVKLQAIKPGSIIKIEVSAEYYARFQKLFFWYSQQDQEKSLKALENLKTQEPQNDFEQHFITLTSMIYAIEDGAKAQGLLEERDFEIPKG